MTEYNVTVSNSFGSKDTNYKIVLWWTFTLLHFSLSDCDTNSSWNSDLVLQILVFITSTHLHTCYKALWNKNFSIYCTVVHKLLTYVVSCTLSNWVSHQVICTVGVTLFYRNICWPTLLQASFFFSFCLFCFCLLPTPTSWRDVV